MKVVIRMNLSSQSGKSYPAFGLVRESNDLYQEVEVAMGLCNTPWRPWAYILMYALKLALYQGELPEVFSKPSEWTVHEEDLVGTHGNRKGAWVLERVYTPFVGVDYSFKTPGKYIRSGKEIPGNYALPWDFKNFILRYEVLKALHKEGEEVITKDDLDRYLSEFLYSIEYSEFTDEDGEGEVKVKEE